MGGLATRVERTGPNSARAERDFLLPPEQVLAAIGRAAGALPRWTVESAGETGVRAVRRTRLFRFADDVSAECSVPEGGAGGAVRVTFGSASRVGRYDFGQNGRNLRELLGAVEEEIRRGP